MAQEWTPDARLKQIAMERAQPLSASLELTYKCNWRCVFCYNPRHHDKQPLSLEGMVEAEAGNRGRAREALTRFLEVAPGTAYEAKRQQAREILRQLG